MMLLRFGRISGLRSIPLIRTQTSQFCDDKKLSEKENVETDAKKKTEEVKGESAANKLNALLASMSTDDNITLTKKVDIPKAGGRAKTKKAKKETDFEKRPKNIIEAAKNVAEILDPGADTHQKRKTESELLSKLLNHIDSEAPVNESLTKSSTDANLNDIIVGMKIDRKAAPKGDSQMKHSFSRTHYVRKALSATQFEPGSEDRFKKPRRKQLTEAVPNTGSVNLFGEEPLGIFKDPAILQDSPDMLKTWSMLEERELKLSVTRPPRNYFEKMMSWTEQGKFWKFPIDNEQGLEEEQNVDFAEHVFLDQHLEGWCPTKGPIRHFMELVCVGLSKNPYITAQEKKEHIYWFKEYFEKKKDLLKDLIQEKGKGKEQQKQQQQQQQQQQHQQQQQKLEEQKQIKKKAIEIITKQNVFLGTTNQISSRAEYHTEAKKSQIRNLSKIKSETKLKENEKDRKIVFIGHSATWLPFEQVKPKVEDIMIESNKTIVFVGHSATWIPTSPSKVRSSSFSTSATQLQGKENVSEIEKKNSDREMNFKTLKDKSHALQTSTDVESGLIAGVKNMNDKLISVKSNITEKDKNIRSFKNPVKIVESVAVIDKQTKELKIVNIENKKSSNKSENLPMNNDQEELLHAIKNFKIPEETTDDLILSVPTYNLNKFITTIDPNSISKEIEKIVLEFDETIQKKEVNSNEQNKAIHNKSSPTVAKVLQEDCKQTLPEMKDVRNPSKTKNSTIKSGAINNIPEELVVSDKSIGKLKVVSSKENPQILEETKRKNKTIDPNSMSKEIGKIVSEFDETIQKKEVKSNEQNEAIHNKSSPTVAKVLQEDNKQTLSEMKDVRNPSKTKSTIKSGAINNIPEELVVYDKPIGKLKVVPSRENPQILEEAKRKNKTIESLQAETISNYALNHWFDSDAKNKILKEEPMTKSNKDSDLPADLQKKVLEIREYANKMSRWGSNSTITVTDKVVQTTSTKNLAEGQVKLVTSVKDLKPKSNVVLHKKSEKLNEPIKEKELVFVGSMCYWLPRVLTKTNNMGKKLIEVKSASNNEQLHKLEQTSSKGSNEIIFGDNVLSRIIIKDNRKYTKGKNLWESELSSSQFPEISKTSNLKIAVPSEIDTGTEQKKNNCIESFGIPAKHSKENIQIKDVPLAAKEKNLEVQKSPAKTKVSFQAAQLEKNTEKYSTIRDPATKVLNNKEVTKSFDPIRVIMHPVPIPKTTTTVKDKTKIKDFNYQRNSPEKVQEKVNESTGQEDVSYESKKLQSSIELNESNTTETKIKKLEKQVKAEKTPKNYMELSKSKFEPKLTNSDKINGTRIESSKTNQAQILKTSELFTETKINRQTFDKPNIDKEIENLKKLKENLLNKPLGDLSLEANSIKQKIVSDQIQSTPKVTSKLQIAAKVNTSKTPTNTSFSSTWSKLENKIKPALSSTAPEISEKSLEANEKQTMTKKESEVEKLTYTDHIAKKSDEKLKQSTISDVSKIENTRSVEKSEKFTKLKDQVGVDNVSIVLNDVTAKDATKNQIKNISEMVPITKFRKKSDPIVKDSTKPSAEFVLLENQTQSNTKNQNSSGKFDSQRKVNESLSKNNANSSFVLVEEKTVSESIYKNQELPKNFKNIKDSKEKVQIKPKIGKVKSYQTQDKTDPIILGPPKPANLTSSKLEKFVLINNHNQTYSVAEPLSHKKPIAPPTESMPIGSQTTKPKLGSTVVAQEIETGSVEKPLSYKTSTAPPTQSMPIGSQTAKPKLGSKVAVREVETGSVEEPLSYKTSTAPPTQSMPIGSQTTKPKLGSKVAVQEVETGSVEEPLSHKTSTDPPTQSMPIVSQTTKPKLGSTVAAQEIQTGSVEEPLSHKTSTAPPTQSMPIGSQTTKPKLGSKVAVQEVETGSVEEPLSHKTSTDPPTQSMPIVSQTTKPKLGSTVAAQEIQTGSVEEPLSHKTSTAPPTQSMPIGSQTTKPKLDRTVAAQEIETGSAISTEDSKQGINKKIQTKLITEHKESKTETKQTSLPSETNEGVTQTLQSKFKPNPEVSLPESMQTMKMEVVQHKIKTKSSILPLESNQAINQANQFDIKMKPETLSIEPKQQQKLDMEVSGYEAKVKSDSLVSQSKQALSQIRQPKLKTETTQQKTIIKSATSSVEIKQAVNQPPKQKPNDLLSQSKQALSQPKLDTEDVTHKTKTKIIISPPESKQAISHLVEPKQETHVVGHKPEAKTNSQGEKPMLHTEVVQQKTKTTSAIPLADYKQPLSGTAEPKSNIKTIEPKTETKPDSFISQYEQALGQVAQPKFDTKFEEQKSEIKSSVSQPESTINPEIKEIKSVKHDSKTVQTQSLLPETSFSKIPAAIKENLLQTKTHIPYQVSKTGIATEKFKSITSAISAKQNQKNITAKIPTPTTSTNQNSLNEGRQKSLATSGASSILNKHLEEIACKNGILKTQPKGKLKPINNYIFSYPELAEKFKPQLDQQKLVVNKTLLNRFDVDAQTKKPAPKNIEKTIDHSPKSNISASNLEKQPLIIEKMKKEPELLKTLSPLERAYKKIDKKLETIQNQIAADDSKSFVSSKSSIADPNSLKEFRENFKTSSTQKKTVEKSDEKSPVKEISKTEKVLNPKLDDENIIRKTYTPFAYYISSPKDKPKSEQSKIKSHTEDKPKLESPFLNLSFLKSYIKEKPKKSKMNQAEKSESIFKQVTNMIKEELFTYQEVPKETGKKTVKLSEESCASQPIDDRKTTIKPGIIYDQVKNMLKEDLTNKKKSAGYQFVIPKSIAPAGAEKIQSILDDNTKMKTDPIDLLSLPGQNNIKNTENFLNKSDTKQKDILRVQEKIESSKTERTAVSYAETSVVPESIIKMESPLGLKHSAQPDLNSNKENLTSAINTKSAEVESSKKPKAILKNVKNLDKRKEESTVKVKSQEKSKIEMNLTNKSSVTETKNEAIKIIDSKQQQQQQQPKFVNEEIKIVTRNQQPSKSLNDGIKIVESKQPKLENETVKKSKHDEEELYKILGISKESSNKSERTAPHKPSESVMDRIRNYFSNQTASKVSVNKVDQKTNKDIATAVAKPVNETKTVSDQQQIISDPLKNSANLIGATNNNSEIVNAEQKIETPLETIIETAAEKITTTDRMKFFLKSNDSNNNSPYHMIKPVSLLEHLTNLDTEQIKIDHNIKLLTESRSNSITSLETNKSNSSRTQLPLLQAIEKEEVLITPNPELVAKVSISSKEKKIAAELNEKTPPGSPKLFNIDASIKSNTGSPKLSIAHHDSKKSNSIDKENSSKTELSASEAKLISKKLDESKEEEEEEEEVEHHSKKSLKNKEKIKEQIHVKNSNEVTQKLELNPSDSNKDDPNTSQNTFSKDSVKPLDQSRSEPINIIESPGPNILDIETNNDNGNSSTDKNNISKSSSSLPFDNIQASTHNNTSKENKTQSQTTQSNIVESSNSKVQSTYINSSVSSKNFLIDQNQQIDDDSKKSLNIKPIDFAHNQKFIKPSRPLMKELKIVAKSNRNISSSVLDDFKVEMDRYNSVEATPDDKNKIILKIKYLTKIEPLTSGSCDSNTDNKSVVSSEPIKTSDNKDKNKK